MTQIAFSPSAVARVALAPGAAAAAMAGLAGLRGLLEPGPEVPLLRCNAEDRGRGGGGALLGQVRVHLSTSAAAAAAGTAVAASTARHLLNFSVSCNLKNSYAERGRLS